MNAARSLALSARLGSMSKDETTRVRQRHLKALRGGMSNAEATAYANGAADLPESPVLARGARIKLAAAPPAADASGPPQLHRASDREPVAPAIPVASESTLPASTETTAHNETVDADRLVQPDRVVFQALLARDFNAFSEFAFSVVRPGLPFKPNWHLEAMAEKLSQVARGRIRRLILTVPPRNLKSLYASVALPAWFLGHSPAQRVVVVSYSEALARNHASDFRQLVNDPIYQATFPTVRLARETDREITTTNRGKRIATSLEGTLTGLGGNLFVIDDPLKLGDAMSESVRNRVIEWYRSTLLSRGDDKTAMRIVVVMQRVHDMDLVGYLLEQGGRLEPSSDRTADRDLRPRRGAHLYPAEG